MANQQLSREQRNKAVAAALYEATSSGNWAAAESMLSEDLVITEADSLPFGGVYRGRGALRELYDRVLPMLGNAEISVKGITAGGEYVIYVLELVPRGRPPIPLVELFRFDDDGKVAEIRPYYFNSDHVKAAVPA